MPQNEIKAVEPKADEPKAVKVDEPKVKADEPKVDDTKVKADEPKVDDTKVVDTKTDEKPDTKPVSRPIIKRPAAAPGWLRVNTDPWSWVTVNGQKLQTSAKFELPPGRYTVVMKSPDYNRPLTMTVVIESGKTKQIVKNFEEDF